MDSSTGDNTQDSPHTYRFRVNRINSLAAGCHKDVIQTISEEADENLPYVTSYPLETIPGSPNLSIAGSETGTAKTSSNKSLFARAASNNLRTQQKQIPVAATMPNTGENTHPPPVRKFSLAGMLGRRKSSNLPDLEDFAQSNSTVGLYGKSLSRYTHDALPKMENYKNMMSYQAAQRPTIEELHDEKYRMGQKGTGETEEEEPSGLVKFGWVEGCLVRCLLNIWGVMLFLRLSWMVAHAGIVHSLIIIAISTVVTTITTLSMSAVSTNGEMKGGGIYYMISRSLGPEWGGAIGVVFSFANSGMAALNTVGFSESMISLLSSHGLKIVDGGQNDNRIISCIAIVALQSIIVIGMEWEAKAQVGLLVILLVAMTDFVIGAFIGPQNDLDYSRGWIGLNGTLLSDNLGPGYRFSEGMEQDFFSIFSIFFPAVAGIQAGASISGDLKDPGEAIPKGTLWAIFITSGSYAIFGILAGAGTLREASGNVTEIDDWSFANCTDKTCKWGLYNDFQVMGLMSAFGPIIYAGCFAATLSSALSCLVSGPKMFQALCKDKVYPYMTRFGVGYGKADDPYWSYAIGFVVALIFILIADLNAIAPLISNFFMATYALLNFCTFHASLVKPLGWRPTFKYCNAWISLIGAIMCVAVMFLMSWVTALISWACVLALFAGVIYRKPDLNWGTSAQAQTYSDALSALEKLAVQKEHVKNYRPQILCLTGVPSNRPALVDFAYLLTKNHSLLICGHIVKERSAPRARKVIIQNGYEWLQLRKVKAFYVMVDNCTFDEGAQALIQATGIGKLAPNILLMGYKENWQTCPREEVQDFFSVLHDALDNYMAIGILRVKGGLNCAHLTGSLATDTEGNPELGIPRSGSVSSMGFDNPGLDLDPAGAVPEFSTPQNPKKAHAVSKLKFGRKRNKSADDLDATGIYRGPDGSDLPKDIIANLSLFHTKQGVGNIDVWWLYDDGGLTLLLPYIVSTRKNWISCKLRVFALANKKDQMEQELRGMASLLSKFRIDYSDLIIIPDITKRAEDTTRRFFDGLIKDFKGDPEDSDQPETVIGDAELLAMKEKTNRHMRLRELILEHSASSNLIVMTLPVPRKGSVSAPLYMAWLETLTRDMPPFLLVRGNQTSVLTFYS
ncbi:Bumetanide-sensitive sodium-(potassium)-chloride cotransporter [Orchesella cincta]|uniref:Bumetanide-sensitive sodium-(Potassium)-chloride cotransporter n=1 Tax=Orchesella cincta TaxID=48709 RepID=A0A1D2MZD0_ORCCI|nr:Bumetanide-sensitive sodium-(potassium)-chloride cotransporter [Orchesella cincta]